MTETAQIKQIVSQGFERWVAGEQSFFDLLPEDIEWTVTGSNPLSGTYRSRTEFLDALEPLLGRLAKPIVPRTYTVYADGDTVIVLWEGSAEAKDGVPYDNVYSWYLTFDGDRIAKVVAFFDGILLAELCERVAPG